MGRAVFSIPPSASPQTPASTPPDDKLLAVSALFSGLQRPDLARKIIPQLYQRFVVAL